MIHYITGGERSGKSSYAQKLALSLIDAPCYLTTARKWDGDFEKRVERHIADRDECWTTMEEEKYLSGLSLKGKVVVLDCITLWLTNWYVDANNDADVCLTECKKELEKFFAFESTLIIISNEIGMGVRSQTAVGRKFTELQCWMNQYIAERADKAIFMVSGLPCILK